MRILERRVPPRVRIGSAVVLGVALAVGTAVAAPARSALVEHFHTLLRATKEVPVRADPSAKPSEGVTLISNVTGAQEYTPFLPPAANAKLKGADFGNVFVLAADVESPIEGYSISIRRVTLVRTARGRRQFCVTAIVRRPASNVTTGHVWVQTHLVLLSARPFRTGDVSWNFPSAWVLLTPAGKTLAVSHRQLGSTQILRVTGQPAACA